ncbi:pantothenate synthetase [Nitrosococcus oceani ATCC 19707]|uniref:Pantothenate synthetase n=2 Tax=Nitrosococcus oceani TaxID=1229 RepID=PANC_NITOC|nr:pantoate--beta-alanine ligase [Nitrosococcus oceani]Q3JCP8.1 RecName: Full=Pantothenate synthetase; Short=PS; AltName: Full=Pantoate--beta-alanine ligase; AltName: Full=Pantoate-activating enzyme [Nitrosococcus oceani ATCC 19707]KFI20170.1 pantoate--beta-alanine ligase [Nitrosococcus oceani C-27]ABA57398.1 pantothenate synthetase [Nitrosococcus oceani ATCC 19707]EDZ68565.1 pantoate--beta-alanine ligase [Nitrosococcus oceani AFC27]GEM21549.1 pantoate--beta-alanine ligase [Nitrosococcus ocean
MRVLRTVAAVRSAVEGWRASHERVALVPTMGNLHRGHLALVERAAQLADRVIVSIFVNPLQFNDRDDYSRYPRTFEKDQQYLDEYGVAVVFAPSLEDIYPQRLENVTHVEVPGLSDILEGASRLGHFRGVTTVVAVLFNIIQPQVAVFGEKDYQQLLIIRRMVADLLMPVEVESIATVRDKDGLALSSRNSYLTKEERARAPILFGALSHAAETIKEGWRNFSILEEEGRQRLVTAGFCPDYFHIRRAEDLAEPGGRENNLVVLAAAYLGKARLIDNMQVQLKSVD